VLSQSKRESKKEVLPVLFVLKKGGREKRIIGFREEGGRKRGTNPLKISERGWKKNVTQDLSMVKRRRRAHSKLMRREENQKERRR